jgi:pyruvate dehydrogenase complex dehydrogenase (E1) component
MSEASPFDDLDPEETREWLESMDSVLKAQAHSERTFCWNG